MRVLFVWGPAVVFMALLFALSSSSDPGPSPEFLSDKILHLGAYAVLGVLILRALADARLARVTWRRAIGAVVLSVLYGVTDEWHQSFVPGRTPDIRDLVADGLGAAIGVLMLLAIRATCHERKPSLPR